MCIRDRLISESNKLQEEKKAVNNQRNDVSIRIEINTGALENIKANLNKLVTTEEKYKWVNALAQTANGNINGKSKIALETYVQISYFERIINRANLRLSLIHILQQLLVRDLLLVQQLLQLYHFLFLLRKQQESQRTVSIF